SAIGRSPPWAAIHTEERRHVRRRRDRASHRASRPNRRRRRGDRATAGGAQRDPFFRRAAFAGRREQRRANDLGHSDEMKKRADVVTEGGDPKMILQNAPATEDNFFLVPKVVE